MHILYVNPPPIFFDTSQLYEYSPHHASPSSTFAYISLYAMYISPEMRLQIIFFASKVMWSYPQLVQRLDEYSTQ